MSVKNKIDGIKEILAEDDLMGLIRMGAPIDEYDHEAEDVSKAITHNSNIEFIQNVLWNVFYNSFCHTITVNHATGEAKVEFANITKANKMIGTISRYKKTAAKLRKFLKKQAP
jgi:hypothetical protein